MEANSDETKDDAVEESHDGENLATTETESSSAKPKEERRPSKNILNLKLKIPNPARPQGADNSTSPDTVPAMPQSAKVIGSSQKPYIRSSSVNVAGKRNTDKNKRSTFQRQSSFLQRTAVIRSGSRRVMQATESFVGIGKNCSEDHAKWKLRHLRYCSIKYGKLKPEVQQKVDEHDTLQSFSGSPFHNPPQIYDPYSRRVPQYVGSPDTSESYSIGAPNSMAGGPLAFSTPPRTPVTPGSRSIGGNTMRMGGQFSTATLRRQDFRIRKDSVARMSWKVVSAMVKGTSVMDDLVGKSQSLEKKSFHLPSLAEEEQHLGGDEMNTTAFIHDMPTIHEGESFPDEVFITSPVQDSISALQYGKIKHRDEVDASPAQSKQQRKPRVKRVLSMALRRKDKREYGKGLVGNWLNRRLTRRRLNSHVARQLDTFDDHRPYFSYWISFVHIVVCIISLVVYGVAPVGFTNFKERFTTTKKSLSRVSEVFEEPQNFWIGPRTKDLIHLGAKYSPCMRQDPKLHEFLLQEESIEKESACCVRKDDSGCIQTSAEECSSLFATWIKWPDPEFDPPRFTNKTSGQVEIRTSGSVCGQDPMLCLDYVLGQADEWPDDITKWPICTNQKKDNNTTYPHMSCELVGRPCCIGQEAKCEIVTQEYCDNKRGVFHPEATLCSQVNCMQDTCGLIEFRVPDSPDQLYRLWLSMLLHAGVIHCLISVVFQMTVLKDVEKLAGWLRISLIYIFSGITGNLASAIFLPYRAEVGPAGSHFGILACLFVEVIQSWQLLSSPGKALAKLCVITAILFFFGMLPWIDNFAHIFGFLSGLLLSFVFLPYITFSDFDKRRKRIQVITCLVVFSAIFTVLVIFFYIDPLTDCRVCHYLNCIPIADFFCSNHGFTPTDRT